MATFFRGPRVHGLQQTMELATMHALRPCGSNAPRGYIGLGMLSSMLPSTPLISSSTDLKSDLFLSFNPLYIEQP